MGNSKSSFDPKGKQGSSTKASRSGKSSSKRVPKRVLDEKLAKASKTGALNLYSCGLREAPDAIWRILNIRTLDLSSNFLSTLSSSVQGLAKLKILKVSGNDLEELPDLSPLSSLRTLEASDNKIVAFPSLPSAVQHADLSGNRMFVFTSSIAAAASLQTLNLSRNHIRSFQTDVPFAELSHLGTLDLDDNAIAELPPEMGVLPKLHALTVRRNKLAAVPPQVLRAPRLSLLRLEGNSAELTKAKLMRTDGAEEFMERRKNRLDKGIAGNVMGIDTSLCGLKL